MRALLELNSTTLSEQLGPDRARALLQRNDAVQGVARQASLGMVHIPEGSSLDQVLAVTTALPHSASLVLHDEPQAPMTPQILQDYQGEIERLKFRLKKRKTKMAQLREEVRGVRVTAGEWHHLTFVYSRSLSVEASTRSRGRSAEELGQVREAHQKA